MNVRRKYFPELEYPGHYSECNLPVNLAAIHMRKENDDDLHFLLVLFELTRADTLNLIPLPTEQKQLLLQQQFKAQQRGFLARFCSPPLERWIVEIDDTAIGRLYLQHTDYDLRIVDIAILPEAQRQGVGTALLHQVFAVAEREKKSVSLSVDASNTARWLYERLGFHVISEAPPYLNMMWRA